ncbi:MAG: hypothetical protein IJA26_03510, partial [Clostridia bacterium]|nr:hypothetical protein [Clostridia bacterium]
MIKEFFGFDGYIRDAEGFFSWQHLVFVSALMLAMAIAAVVFGKKYKNRSTAEKNRALAVAAILMDGIELTKIILKCTFGGDPMAWLYDLPLFMCSIQLITLPLAAFAKGRLKEAALDFVC